MRKTQICGPGTAVQCRIHEPLLSAVDDYRRTQRDPPSRAQALLQIVEKALLARSQHKASARGSEFDLKAR
jgi:hypothetical protein